MEDFIPRYEDTELRVSPRTGYYQVEWTVPAGKSGTGRARTRTYSCRTKDPRLAEDIRREYVASLRATAGAIVSEVVPSVLDLVGKYRRLHLDAGNLAVTQAESLKPIERLLGATLVDELDSELILSGYIKVRVFEGVKSGTIRRELGALVAVLNWSWRERLLPKGFAVPHIPLPQESPPREYVLDDADEKRLHYAAEDFLNEVHRGGRHPAWRGALFILIALNQAARSKAIETLDWSRVDWGARRIDFRDPDIRATRKRRVVQPMSDRLKPILFAEWQRQGQPTSGPVLGFEGSTRKAFATIKAYAFGARHKALTRHDLRRTWASLAASRGVPMKQIADVLGDSLETTERHYAHLSPDHLRDAINARA